MNTFFRGDTIKLLFQLFKDESKTNYWNLTDNEIRFQLTSGSVVIKKATANVTGGSDEQIYIVNASRGLFEIIIEATESSTLSAGEAKYEIQVTNENNEIYTVLQGIITIKEDLIQWTALTE